MFGYDLHLCLRGLPRGAGDRATRDPDRPGSCSRRATALRSLARQLAAWGLAAALAPAALAQASGSAYAYVAPPGWAAAMEADIETLTPQGEPAGTAQVMLLAPKAASGAFNAQFDAERAALEQFWGLRAPQATPLQTGQAAVGAYVAYFASYDSDGGPRYMGFMALGNAQKFGMLIFVADSDTSFNRLAPQAAEIFKSLSLR